MNNQENPLVSIITPMKNSSAYIFQTVQSVLLQSYKNWELIVVDDCSTDGGKSVEIVNNFAKTDERIKLVLLKQGKGSSGARNEGLKNVTGQLLAFLDSDDVWHEDYLQQMVENILREKSDAEASIDSPAPAVYYCGYRRMDETMTFELKKPYSCVGKKDFKSLLRFCPLFPSITIIDLEKLPSEIKSDIKFRENLKSLRDDYVFILDILQKGFTAMGFPQILVDYRLRKDSLTSSKLKMIKPQWKVYRKVLKIGLLKSCFYLCCWAVNGVKKYWL